MKEIAIIGDAQFALGFRLAGVRKVFETEDAEKVLEELLEDTAVGLVIISEKAKDSLSYKMQMKMEKIISPVTVVVGRTGSDDDLRRMIKKSIGVDM
ncbi:hypothetical protein H6504_05410 [Candidatus Woesearchaeota archaeon]|nr:hypothetical protein [Candidatus Woesearchaeota archaeon]